MSAEGPGHAGPTAAQTTQTTRTTVAVVGRGYRARAWMRLAGMLPGQLRLSAVAVRDAAGAAALEADGAAAGTPVVVGGVAELLARERPDVVLTSVPAGANAGLLRELVAAGVAVLSETPPSGGAPAQGQQALPALHALWADVGASGLVQVAEQYPRHPMTAARLAVVASGALGEPTSAHVSMTQTHHAVALLRAALGVAGDDARVTAVETTAPLADPFSRAGWTGSDVPRPLATTLAVLELDGRVGLYDVTETQTRNPLRRSRFLVRGTRGELDGTRVVRLADATTVVTSDLVRRQTGQHDDFEVPGLDVVTFEGAVVHRSPFWGTRLSDEEEAMASLLLATGRWARGEGPPPYPLAQACQDAALGDAVTRAAATRVPVRLGSQPWAAALAG